MTVWKSSIPVARHVVRLALLFGMSFGCGGSYSIAQAPTTVDADTPQLEFVFEENVTLGDEIRPGATPWGERNIVPITGGTISGPRIKGKVLPGGWDWQLSSKSGCNRIQADYMIQTDDGVVINVLNKATMCGNTMQAPAKAADAPANVKGAPSAKDAAALRDFTTPVFEAPLGRYEWLNGGAYVGTLGGTMVDGKFVVHIRFYKAH